MATTLREMLTFVALWSARRAWLALSLLLLSSVLSLGLTASLLKFNSDKESLVSENAPFQQRNADFNKAFPQFLNSLLIVIDATSAAQAQNIAEGVAARLNREPDRFSNVFLAEGDAFFQRHGLLYLSVDELEMQVDRFAEAEPALAAIAADPSLRGVFDLMALGVNAVMHGDTLPSTFEKLAADLLRTARAVQHGQTTAPIGGFLTVGETSLRRIVTVQPALDFTSQSAERASIQHLRALLAEPEFSGPGVRIRLTGRVALADDEIWAIQDSMFLAGFLSVALAGALLGFALRSFRLIAAILITLFVGLAWTMGFATLSVGSLNMISAAVIVLFIGLGIDHAIHVSLRYREARQAGQSHMEGIRTAADEMGGAVALCATTSAIGFAAFIPTEYRGLAELGLIAAGSLFLAFVASFTVLPALLTLLGDDKARAHVPQFVTAGVSDWLTGHSMKLSLGVALAAFAALYVSGAPKFDFSTLAIRDTSSESVVTLLELQDDGVVTDYAAEILVRNAAEAQALASRLLALPQVSEVLTPASFVPTEQDLKLAILGDAEGFLWSALSARPSDGLTDAERIDIINTFARLTMPLADTNALNRTLKELAATLLTLSQSAEGTAHLAELERRIAEPLTRDVARLRNALAAGLVRFDDLPATLKDRLVGTGDRLRVTAISAEPLLDTAALENFVTAIRSVSPDATGRALTEADVGALVVRSFYLAGLIAFTGIALLLIIVLRSPVDAAFVLVPLGLAACFTIATADLFGISFNFANIVVLPLIFGLGVDSGIHFVLRRRSEETIAQVMTSSTPQAIVLSALSTIGAFSALSLSRHWGMASMGILLTIAVFWVIVCTVIVLPALMDWRDKARA